MEEQLCQHLPPAPPGRLDSEVNNEPLEHLGSLGRRFELPERELLAQEQVERAAT